MRSLWSGGQRRMEGIRQKWIFSQRRQIPVFQWRQLPLLRRMERQPIWRNMRCRLQTLAMSISSVELGFCSRPRVLGCCRYHIPCKMCHPRHCLIMLLSKFHQLTLYPALRYFHPRSPLQLAQTWHRSEVVVELEGCSALHMGVQFMSFGKGVMCVPGRV